MTEEKFENLLAKLSDSTQEPVRSGLSDDIKKHIPRSFAPHRRSLETINIIIDFRINKLAAAAAIFITLIVCFSLLDGGLDFNGADLYREGKLIIEHIMGKNISKDETSSIAAIRYKTLISQGRNAIYLGNNESKDSNSILMYWRLPDGNYKAVFTDLRERTLNPEELIELQSLMLQHQNK